MRCNRIVCALSLALLMTTAGLAQSDKLAGRWEGKTQMPQGERATTATFKKEGDAYTGTITGMRGEMPLKDIKLDGEKVTAKAEVETPQGALTINYSFTLQGDALKGTGELNFGGNPFSFDVDLKRAAPGAAATAPATGAPAPGAQTDRPAPRPQRVEVPQPQQKQSIDYFVGQWSFKYIGRESALGMAPREGVLSFTKRADGKTLDGVIEGKHEGGPYKESLTVVYDEATKQLSFTEKPTGKLQLNSRGDWSSPISIRFTVEPLKVKGQTLQLRRTISIVAAHSFTVAEELSEDGGPFVRLGSAVYSKVGK